MIKFENIICLIGFFWILNLIINTFFFVETKEDEIINVIENFKNANSLDELQLASNAAVLIAKKQHENYKIAKKVADNVQDLTDDFIESEGDYRLNDMPDSCDYNSIQDLYWNCKKNPQCKGFNTKNGKPGCMKYKLENKSEDPQYNFYQKKSKPTYNFFTGNYKGNSYNCGKYNSIEAIRRACNKDDKCQGFNLRNSTPYCLKSKLKNRNSMNDFTFYTKSAPK